MVNHLAAMFSNSTECFPVAGPDPFALHMRIVLPAQGGRRVFLGNVRSLSDPAARPRALHQTVMSDGMFSRTPQIRGKTATSLQSKHRLFCRMIAAMIAVPTQPDVLPISDVEH